MNAETVILTPREQFEEFLSNNSKRRTPERFAILEKVAEMPGHFCAEELASELRTNGYPVSDATVYSTLDLMVECGLAHRLRLSERFNVYTYAFGRSNIHHYTVCTHCGKIAAVSKPHVNELLRQQSYTGFSPAYHSLVIYGLCAKCRRRRKYHKNKN